MATIDLKKLINAKVLALIASIGALGYVTLKDLIFTGADVKFKNKVVAVVIHSDAVDGHIDTLIQDKIDNTMKNPLIWLEVLGSDFVGDYAEQKVEEAERIIDEKISARDSAQQDFDSYIGELLGIRDEAVRPLLGNLMKDYKEGKLKSTRRVEVDI